MKVSELEALTEEVPVYAPRLTKSTRDHLDELPHVPLAGILVGFAISLAIWVVIGIILMLVF